MRLLSELNPDKILELQCCQALAPKGSRRLMKSPAWNRVAFFLYVAELIARRHNCSMEYFMHIYMYEYYFFHMLPSAMYKKEISMSSITIKIKICTQKYEGNILKENKFSTVMKMAV